MMLYNDDIYDLTFIKFDIEKLRAAYQDLTEVVPYSVGMVNGILLTKMVNEPSGDPRGIFWITNKEGAEEQREQKVDENLYTELRPEIKNTYFEKVYNKLSKHFVLGRVRILLLKPRKCLSFHRDPEPRLHIPIISQPGALMVVEDFCTHMPADGSVYYMNTTKYHSALNGSEENRIHLVATILDTIRK
jgi:hypothetical protein|tara:strand:+ start:993 stop:1559 length:567 start_codon:yes stop_codon:yes gene_type:complete